MAYTVTLKNIRLQVSNTPRMSNNLKFSFSHMCAIRAIDKSALLSELLLYQVIKPKY